MSFHVKSAGKSPIPRHITALSRFAVFKISFIETQCPKVSERYAMNSFSPHSNDFFNPKDKFLIKLSPLVKNWSAEQQNGPTNSFFFLISDFIKSSFSG